MQDKRVMTGLRVWMLTFVLVIPGLIVTGCVNAPTQAFRTFQHDGLCLPGDIPRLQDDWPKENTSCRCDADQKGIVPDHCQHQAVEIAAHYELLFAEFDDEGWVSTSQGDIGLHGRSSDQPYDQLASVEYYLHHLPCQRLLIIVFVHGWKHDASSDDSNVMEFRRELERLGRDTEQRIVGLYVGWRGASVYGSDIAKDATFFARKAAAERVSQGSVRELLSFVGALQRSRSTAGGECSITDSTRALPIDGAHRRPSGKSPPSPNLGEESLPRDGKSGQAGHYPPPSPNYAIHTIFIGHSFGGLILYEALGPRMLDELVEDDLFVRDKLSAETRSGADLVILVNPAIEASRFEPLYRAIRERNVGEYEAPRLIMITSKSDDATRLAFPLSRWFSGNSRADPERNTAYLDTIGHAQPYVTHELTHKSGAGECHEINADLATNCFGAGNVLIAREIEYNRYPVWNVLTDSTVSASHNDIDSFAMQSFVAAAVDEVLRVQRRLEEGVSAKKSVGPTATRFKQ
jgi:hypothetical protein